LAKIYQFIDLRATKILGLSFIFIVITFSLWDVLELPGTFQCGACREFFNTGTYSLGIIIIEFCIILFYHIESYIVD